MLIKNCLSPIKAKTKAKMTNFKNSNLKKSITTSMQSSITIENMEQSKEQQALITNMDNTYDNLNLDNEKSTHANNPSLFNDINSKDLVDDRSNREKVMNHSKNQNDHGHTEHLNAHLKRRFSETYYKSLEHYKRPRLVKKCGELNIHMGNVPKHKRRLLSDFFNTILDIRWRWHIVVFFLSFLISWFVFATIWYLIAFLHGDLNPTNVNPNLSNSIPEFQDQSPSNSNIQTENSTLELLLKFNPTNFTNNNSQIDLNEIENIDILNKSIILIDHVIKSFKNQNNVHIDSDSIKDSEDQFDPFNSTLADFLSYRLLNRRSSENEGQSSSSSAVKKPKKHLPCVHGIHDFTSAFLYSVETQHTIGYGLRYITEECSFAIIFLMLQSCFGIFVQGLVAGVVFAKISRPSKRKRTIIFSHNAVVSERDGKLCFMFKIGNIRISQLSDARLKLQMIKSRRTSEGEFIPFQSYDMKVGYDWTGDGVFFPWPKTIEHVIDEHSPFYEMCKNSMNKHTPTEQLNSINGSCSTSRSGTLTPPIYPLTGAQEVKQEDYEIVVILEGNIETTGASCHIRTSYLPQEILFGYRFVPVYPKFTDAEYLFDYSKFDQVEPFNFNLLHLNVAHFHRDLNYVCDTRNENKNYHLTFQNTSQHESNKPDYLNQINFADDKNEKHPVSILSILNAFKAHSNQEFKEKEEKIVKNKKILDGVENPISSSSNEKYADTMSTWVSESKPDVQNIGVKGRFTVVPVNESNDVKPRNRKFSTQFKNDKSLKQPKQVVFNNISSVFGYSNQNKIHLRANSLPPIYSESILDHLNDNLKNESVYIKTKARLREFKRLSFLIKPDGSSSEINRKI